MGIKVHEDGRKAYKLKRSGTYRLEGDNLYDRSVMLYVDSMLVTVTENTIVIAHEVYVDPYNPEYIRAFVPSLNAYITSISLFDLENVM
jgi:hypothetical protein